MTTTQAHSGADPDTGVRRIRRSSPLATAALLIGAAYCLVPVLWVVVASTKSASEAPVKSRTTRRKWCHTAGADG